MRIAEFEVALAEKLVGKFEEIVRVGTVEGEAGKLAVEMETGEVFTLTIEKA